MVCRDGATSMPLLPGCHCVAGVAGATGAGRVLWGPVESQVPLIHSPSITRGCCVPVPGGLSPV